MGNILITICARGGSRGLPGKALLPMSGKPLICHSVETAIKFSRTCKSVTALSSDSLKIISAVMPYSSVYLIERPAELAKDDTPKLDTIRHALFECERDFETRFDTVIDLDVTNPLRTVKDIQECYKLFKQGNFDTIFSVTPAKKNPYFNQVEDRDGIKLVKDSGLITDRQSCKLVFDINCNIYIYDRDWLADAGNLSPISGNTGVYVMPEWTSVDIDNEVDFFMVEKLMEEYLK